LVAKTPVDNREQVANQAIDVPISTTFGAGPCDDTSSCHETSSEEDDESEPESVSDKLLSTNYKKLYESADSVNRFGVSDDE